MRASNGTPLAIAIVGMLGFADAVCACSCMGPVEPLIAMASADAVFVATILSVTGPPARSWHGTSEMVISTGDRMTYRARVQHAWKGAKDTVNVYTARSGPSCGFEFKVGSQYLIYGSWRDSLPAYEPHSSGWAVGEFLPPGVATNSCSRTTEIEDALYDLHKLGPPSMEVEGTTLPDASVEGLTSHLQVDGSPFFWSAATALSLIHEETDVVVEAMRRVIHSGDRKGQMRASTVLYQLGPAAANALPDLMGLLGRLEGSDEDGPDYFFYLSVKRAVERIRGPLIAPMGRHVYGE